MASSCGFPAMKSQASGPASSIRRLDSTKAPSSRWRDSMTGAMRGDRRSDGRGAAMAASYNGTLGPPPARCHAPGSLGKVPAVIGKEDRSAPALGTMLGVWAHPDDETYLTAGLMALGVRQGGRVVCVTATRGEEGSFDEELWPSERMGAVREAELLRSLEVLGVREHIWLDYRDGTCAKVDPDEGRARVQAIMRDVRPDSVFTFGPDGMTGHADHKAVCAW